MKLLFGAFGAFGKPAIVLSCMFPCFMFFVEWLFKTASQTGTGTGTVDFFGPSLAATGVGFLVPLTTSKPTGSRIPLPPALQKQFDDDGIVLKFKCDDLFSQFIWIMILVFLGVWMGSLQMSANHSNITFVTLPIHIWLGLFNYFIGVILTCVKEVI